MVRVGLVGFGSAAKVFHAPMISAVDGLELAAVVERSARVAGESYPGIASYPSLEAMLTDQTLELIVIPTPNATHAPLAMQALRAGRHVVVDKPVAPESDAIAELIAVASEAGRLLIPFHNRRWDSDFQTLHKLLLQEILGRVVYLESTFDRWRQLPKLGSWREDGTPGTGLLLDLGTHLVDQALALFGLPDGVYGEVAAERDGARVNDAFTVHLRYSGLLVSLSANCLASQPRPRFTVRGTLGNWVKWGLDPQETRLKENPRFALAGVGDEPESAWGTLTAMVDGEMIERKIPTIAGTYRDFYAGVRDSVLGRAAAPVAATDAWRVARILEWAAESAVERREIACDWGGEPAG